MNEKRTIRIDDKDLFSPSEVAEILDVSYWAVMHRYIHKGLLKAHKIGNGTGKRGSKRHWRIWRQDLEDFINKSGNIKEGE